MSIGPSILLHQANPKLLYVIFMLYTTGYRKVETTSS